MSNKAERASGYFNTPGVGKMIAGYGLSLAELEKVRKAQLTNSTELVPAIGAKTKDGKLYKIPSYEFAYVYHIELESPLFDQFREGERLDRGPVVHKFNEAAFALMEKTDGFKGKKMRILHDPTKAQIILANAAEEAEKNQGTKEAKS